MTKETLEMELRQKVKRYRALTEKALKKVKIKVAAEHGLYAAAADFLVMAQNYFKDAQHFERGGKLLTALAAYSYAHAWLDAGVRAELFDAKGDSKLFTLP